MKIITQNKKAFFDYDILYKLEAGIVLTGDEVKSIRAGHVSLVGGFATIRSGELYLTNCSITPYVRAYMPVSKDQADKSRKLLVHRRELERLVGEISQKGVTIVALRLYINERNRIKVELGIARHKKAADKRQSIKEKDVKRETARELKKYKN